MELDRLTLLGVPIDSVGREGGTELAPAAMRAHLSETGMRDAGDTVRKIHGTDRDIKNGWLAYEDIVAMSAEVRSKVAAITAAGQVPVVIGGCCTLLPAALAGARDTYGDIGLAYFDGHLDLFTGLTSPTGEGADMPVAVTLGEAPEELLFELGPSPIVEAPKISLIGARDKEELQMISPLPGGIDFNSIHDREELRHEDLASLGRRLAGELGDRGRKFWLHIDVDVLGQENFPATDYLMPDGLSIPELKALTAPLAASPGLVGINITCFNPEKDADGSCGRQLAGMLESILDI